MRLLRRPLALLALLLPLGAIPARGQVLPYSSGPDIKAQVRELNVAALRDVSAMLAGWRGAWARNDARATARFYTDDALLLIGGGDPLRGRKQIENGFAEILATRGLIQVGVDDFQTGGGLAYAFGRFWYQNEGGQASPDVAGTYMMVFRKDGRGWKIRSQMFSSSPARQTAGGGAGAETPGTGAP